MLPETRMNALQHHPGGDAEHQDERHVEPARAHEPQRLHAVELRQGVIRHDEVEFRRQPGREIRLGIHSFPLRIESSLAQRVDYQVDVRGVVLQYQDPDGPAGRRRRAIRADAGTGFTVEYPDGHGWPPVSPAGSAK